MGIEMKNKFLSKSILPTIIYRWYLAGTYNSDNNIKLICIYQPIVHRKYNMIYIIYKQNLRKKNVGTVRIHMFDE